MKRKISSRNVRTIIILFCVASLVSIGISLYFIVRHKPERFKTFGFCGQYHPTNGCVEYAISMDCENDHDCPGKELCIPLDKLRTNMCY